MRRTVATLLLLVGACASKGPPATGGTTPTAPEPAGTRAPGTAYFAGLDWGMSTEAVTAVYPELSWGGGSWQTELDVNGAPGVLSLTIDEQTGLSEGTWRESGDGYPSPETCAAQRDVWRATMDAQLGASTVDDRGEPEWKTATADVSVICSEDVLGGAWRLWLSAFPR